MKSKIKTLKNELNSLLNKKSYDCLDSEVIKKSEELDIEINKEMLKQIKGGVLAWGDL